MDNQITHLTKVEIKGLWGKQDIVWDLNADVNVLAGGNGSGKTTILDCIYELILKGEKYESRLDVIKKISLTFNQGILLSSRRPMIEQEQNPNVFTFYYPYRDYSLKIKIDLISTFDNTFQPLDAIQKLSDDRVKTDLDWKIYELQKQYIEYQLNLSRKTIKIFKKNNEIKNNELEKILFPQKKLIKIINKLFSETKKEINQDENELVFLLGDEKINAYQLSSGEKQLLIILLTVLIQDNQPSILFMDEPEISLHMDWQEKLIQYIRELNPNVQLIIATHSPSIIMDGWLDKISEISDLIVNDKEK